jgi:BNR/Asp-box repeat
MKTKYLFYISIVTLFVYSCKKNNVSPAASNSVQISLVSGNNQSGQIGNFLSDSIVVKVTNQTGPLTGYTVQFIGSGCNDDIPVNISTKTDGTAVYHWALASDAGTQTLWAVVINGKTRLDSISISANAGEYSNVRRSACTPPYVTNSIARLSTGRLLASFSGTTSVRYSDDNGASWHALTSFGSTHFTVLLATSPKDEILVTTGSEGLFYSKDAGNTWVNISPPGFNKQDAIGGLTFTNSGNIIFCGNGYDYYISTDKGATWTNAQSGFQSNTGYGYPAQLNNGDLYIASLSGILYKSVDGGKTWTSLPSDPNVRITGICTDSNGGFYKAWSSSSIASPSSTIAVSNDNGVSFKNLYVFTSTPYIDGLEILNGNVFFEQLASEIDGIITPTVISTFGTEEVPFASYTLTNGGRLVYAKFDGIYY